MVLKNQSVGRSWNAAVTLARVQAAGLSFRSSYSYNVSENTVDAGSIAAGSWNGNPHSGDPNNPGLSYSTPFGGSLGHRFFALVSYNKEFFRFGATSVSLFWESRNNGNTSYIFANDMNGDSGALNDLIYIPRDTSEMNFRRSPSGLARSRPAEQAAAFEAYIQQDRYLSEHRGEYAKRGAVLLPIVNRADLSITQDLFANIRRPAQCVPDPRRHPELRESAEQRLGRRSAPDPQPDPHQRCRRRERPGDLPDGRGQQRAADPLVRNHGFAEPMSSAS